MKKAISQLISIMLVAVIAFVCGFGGSIVKDYLVQNDILNLSFLETSVSTDKANPGELSNGSEDIATGNVTINVSEDTTIAEAIAAKVLPSVVGISTVYEVTFSGYDFFGWGGGGYSQDAEAVGTGFVVNSDGYIVTNAHVVNDGNAKEIKVSLYDGDVVPGVVLWSNSALDLAIVKVEVKGLDVAELGDSDEVNVGSYAAAIGNPLGLAFERSMSQGIISGLNRTIEVQNDSGSITTMEGLIQTDATINSGNSGGPLLNSKGQVIGINSAKAGSGEGMGFAIPINTVKPIVEQIIKTGSYDRPYIGITGIGLDEQTSYTDAQLEEYFGTTTGIYVYSVSENGGAEEAGLEKGDIIVEVDGNAVSTMNKLNTLLVGYNPGDTVKLKVLREKKSMTFDVRLTGEIKDIY